MNDELTYLSNSKVSPVSVSMTSARSLLVAASSPERSRNSVTACGKAGSWIVGGMIAIVKLASPSVRIAAQSIAQSFIDPTVSIRSLTVNRRASTRRTVFCVRHTSGLFDATLPANRPRRRSRDRALRRRCRPTNARRRPREAERKSGRTVFPTGRTSASKAQARSSNGRRQRCKLGPRFPRPKRPGDSHRRRCRRR